MSNIPQQKTKEKPEEKIYEDFLWKSIKRQELNIFCWIGNLL